LLLVLLPVRHSKIHSHCLINHRLLSFFSLFLSCVGAVAGFVAHHGHSVLFPTKQLSFWGPKKFRKQTCKWICFEDRLSWPIERESTADNISCDPFPKTIESHPYFSFFFPFVDPFMDNLFPSVRMVNLEVLSVPIVAALSLLLLALAA
jgi:hypothetical protein